MRPAASSRELAGLIDFGEPVRTTYGTGQVVEGRALGLTLSSLTVVAGGGRLELDEASVALIRQRSDDSIRDGVRTGLLPGAVPATALMLYIAEHEGFVPGMLGVVGMAGVAGAALGALVDTYRRGERDIYRTPGRLRVSPSLSPHRLGTALSLSR